MRFLCVVAPLCLSFAVAGCGEATGDAKDPTSATGSAGVGSKGSAFSLAPMNGAGKVSLPSGKVVVVDFWATWCEPCRKSFPKLQELYTKYAASGLEIAAISEDEDKDGIAEFVKTYGAKFPVGWDEDKSVAKKWGPKSMPSTFIVDKAGVVRYVHTGYHDGEEADLEKEIKELLK